MLPLGLSFQQAPPYSVPLRFFVTAPLFLLAAATLLGIAGPDLLASRHSPAALAATHLLTLGFSSMVMCGALFQLLPVLGGVPLAHPGRAAWLVHAPLTIGTACLAAAFLWHQPLLFALAATALAAAFGYFGVRLAPALWKARGGGPSLRGMRTALMALALTLTLGLALAAAFGGRGLPVPYARFAPAHPLWGLGGWTALLIVGLAYQLIPMFHLTAPYPALMTSRLVPSLFLLLAAATLAEWIPGPVGSALSKAATLGLAAGYLWFAAVTWRLFERRRRKVPDTTLQFWRLGLLLLSLSCCIAAAGRLTDAGLPDRWQLAAGILALPGFILCVIQGMLYKIIPFLTWFHLQSAYPGLGIVPNVREIHARFHAPEHLALFAVALATLVAACWIPELSRVAGMLWAVQALWLEANVVQAAQIFRTVGQVARMREAH